MNANQLENISPTVKVEIVWDFNAEELHANSLTPKAMLLVFF